jgi:hypothetical protein
MKCLCWLLAAWGLFSGPVPGLFAVQEEAPAHFFSWGLLYTGSWFDSFNTAESSFSAKDIVYGGILFNRADFRLGIPSQTLSLRFQALDKRYLPSEKDKDLFTPGFGFYYEGGGLAGKFLGNVRILRGVMEEYGLPGRLRNIWAKSPPFAENRKPPLSELLTSSSASREPETYLYLGLPRWKYFSGFASVKIDDEFNPAFSAGAETRWSKTGNLRLDAFYTQKKLAPRKQSTWFSPAPALPGRDFKLWALGTVLNTEYFGFAADGALSETFAFGRDYYTSAAFRLGGAKRRPGASSWKLSLAGDAAGSRFVDQAGTAVGSGFRVEGALERQWIRSAVFRFNTVLKAPEPGERFDKASFSLYFRPSAPPPKTNAPVRFTRTSLSVSRDARTPAKTADALEGFLGFNIGPVRAGLGGALHYFSVLEGSPPPLPFPPSFGVFDSAKFSGELNWDAGIFDLRSKVGYCIREGKDNLWDIALGAAFKPVKRGSFRIKIASPDFPSKWNYTISWKAEIGSR